METSNAAVRAAEAVEQTILREALEELRLGQNDRIRESVNWGMVVGLLGCLAFWGLIVLGLVVAF